MESRGGESGMTLVEMLAVLAIIGVAAGATALGIGAATRAPSVESEARRLSSRLQSVADEAMVSDRPVAFTWDAKSYAFLDGDGAAWREGSDDGHARHRLPAGIRLDMGRRTPPLLLGVDGSGVPAAIGLKAGDDRWLVVYDGLSATPVAAPAA
ncbi:GspH/FimT family pseudopilin [Rhizorhabdus dicambivorans]|uniref:Type II secretion system protein H n=1 Tax=Rhizorhabdus dicambivorans TaxID=1850238 RepID=A0A2A4FSL8_9SPHN|nr:GspH/FimT family pseudopilin [Rhizorhabdus dicambivorans]ATE63533.1 type II secretion system protein GspH [Rhizorhabdus dicambivorans]PCE41413.1 type II secretion system protein GspH [Rhizorhabdus dicambivorans]